MGIIEKVLNKPREILCVNLSQKILNTHQDTILKMGPKHILKDSINLKETTPRAESVIEMLLENDRQRFRFKYQKELERRMRKCDRDREERRDLERMMRRDKEIACLHSNKTRRTIIMNREEYNYNMKEAIV